MGLPTWWQKLEHLWRSSINQSDEVGTFHGSTHRTDTVGRYLPISNQHETIQLWGKKGSVVYINCIILIIIRNKYDVARTLLSTKRRQKREHSFWTLCRVFYTCLSILNDDVRMRMRIHNYQYFFFVFLSIILLENLKQNLVKAAGI